MARQKRERKAEPVAAITPAAEEATDKSPNDVLAEEISDALVSAGLVLEKHRGDLLGKLKAGGVSQDDWGLWIDMATAPNSRTAGSEGNDNG